MWPGSKTSISGLTCLAAMSAAAALISTTFLRGPFFPSSMLRVISAFSSGLPLGLVWIAIPDWMRDIGVDIRWVGLLTLAQAPWTLKFFWAPLMDRFAPPFWGRRRGWAALTQVALLLLTIGVNAVLIELFDLVSAGTLVEIR